MNFLVLSCKKVTELIEKKSVVKLSLKETLQLSLHTSMCSACSRYEKQSKIIDSLLKKHLQDGVFDKIEIQHTQGLKEKIKKLI